MLPLLGGKEGVAHVCFAMLDPGDVCLAADPGYPVYTSGTLLAGGEPHLMPLTAANRFLPDLDGIGRDVTDRANLLFCNYPNNPTGAVVEDDFFDRLAAFGLDRGVPSCTTTPTPRSRSTATSPRASSRRRAPARRGSRCSRSRRPTT